MNITRAVANLLLRSGLSPALRRRALRRGAFVLMFHGTPAEVPDEIPLAARPALDAAGLARVLAWLGANEASPLTPADLLGGRPGVLLTFDDGFANNVEQALPELLRLRFPALFFITLQHVLDPTDWLPSIRRGLDGLDLARISPEARHDLFDGMSLAQLERLAASPDMTIGSHTLSHPFLTRLDDASLARELGESRHRLAEISGQNVDWLAYPTGDYDRRIAEAAEDAGYRAAVVESSRGVARPLYEIPRVGIYDSSRAVLEAKLSGLFRRPWRPPA